MRALDSLLIAFRSDVIRETKDMQRLKKPGYRFLLELVMFPSAIGMIVLVLSVTVG